MLSIVKFFLIISVSLVPCLHAKNWGNLGESFPIQEEDISKVLQNKMSAVTDGVIINNQDLLTKKAKNPRSGALLLLANSYSQRLYDPSIVLEENILDSTGTILFPKGTTVNPLEYIQLEDGLLFFDGENKSQVLWAKAQEGKFKWVLIKGSPLKLEEEEQKEVYFDQGGVYCKKFDLTKYPTKITQKNKCLLIEEFPVCEEVL